MKDNIKKLIWWGSLLFLFPITAVAINISVDELKQLQQPVEQNLGEISSSFWNQKLGTYLEPALTSGAGILVKGTGRYVNFGSVYGSSGYGIRDNSGSIECKNSGGSWSECQDGSGSGGTTINQLGEISDVSTTSPEVFGHILRFNDVTAKWESVATSTLGISADTSLLVPYTGATANLNLGLFNASTTQLTVSDKLWGNTVITGGGILQLESGITVIGDGTALTISAGDGVTGGGGELTLTSGNAFSGNAGDIVLAFGNGDGVGGLPGRLKIMNESGFAFYFDNDVNAIYPTADRVFTWPNWTGNVLIGSSTSLYVATTTGNVGIGTTSPYAKLSVVGVTLSDSFTATSTTATSTFPYLSATRIGVTGIANCDTIDTDAQGYLKCGSDASGGSGGAGTVSTSSSPTIGNLAYWTSKDAWPETLGTVATTTLTATAPLSLSQTVAKVGGSNSVLTCTAASASAAGCLASTDWTTFNNKVGTSTVPTSGNIPYWTGQTLGTIATTSLTATYPLSLSQPITVIGALASALTVVATSTQYGTGSYGQVLMWNTVPTFTATSSLGLASTTHTHLQFAPATSTLSTIYGGTGNKLYNYGDILVGNATSSLTIMATSSLGLASTTHNHLQFLGLTGGPTAITLGTITTGTWTATPVTTIYGGTGLGAGGLKATYIPFGAGTSPFATSTDLYATSRASGYELTATYASSTAFTTNFLQLDTDTTGVTLDTDGDGMLIIAGTSAGSDEDLRINLDDAANEIDFTSGTGVTKLDFSGINNSTFTYASTTSITASGVASSTNLIVSNIATTTGMVVGTDGTAMGGCLAIRDASKSAWTYCYTNAGAMVCSATADCGSATSTIQVGR